MIFCKTHKQSPQCKASVIAAAVLEVALWLNNAASANQQANAENNERLQNGANSTNTSNHANVTPVQTVSYTSGQTADLRGESEEGLGGMDGGSQLLGGIFISSASNGTITTVQYKQGKLRIYGDGQLRGEYTGKDPFLLEIKSGLDGLRGLNEKRIKMVLSAVENSQWYHPIQNYDDVSDGNPNQEPGSYTVPGRVINSTFTRYVPRNNADVTQNLGHELKHIFNLLRGLNDYSKYIQLGLGNMPAEELDAIDFENVIRKAQGATALKRTTFAGKDIQSILTPVDDYNPIVNPNLRKR